MSALLDDFIVRALIAGVGFALVAGPLGCFVVWRRMAYFGAALSHAALLGIALGFLFGIRPGLGIFLVAVLVALALVALEGRQRLSPDTLLGIMAHAALAAGLVAVSLMEFVRVDLMAYLFGDMLAVDRADLLWIYGGGAIVLAGLAALWRPLLSLTVHEELAQVEGVHTIRVRLAFMLLIAIVIAVAVKLVGLLLVVSLLIIPAAAARRVAATPEAMAALAALVGCVAVAVGLGGSLVWDTPSGPSIVVAAALLFAVTTVVPTAWPDGRFRLRP